MTIITAKIARFRDLARQAREARPTTQSLNAYTACHRVRLAVIHKPRSVNGASPRPHGRMSECIIEILFVSIHHCS